MNKRKTILIGLDGCTFKILKPLINDGYLPAFAEILKEGCHTHLISTLPFNTLPAWTSIFTGVNPGKHGITDFTIRENGEYKITNIGKHRMVDSLWKILSRHNKEQIIVNEPVTYPPEKINGIMLAGFSTPFENRNFAYPPSIENEIDRICNGYMPDLPFAFEKIIAKDKNKGFELISKFAEKTFRTTKYLIKNYSWDLLSVIFTSTDRLQHFYFHNTERIRSHYQLLDKFIDEIISLESEANILIVSDHGFGPINKCFYINTWLKDQNLVAKNQSTLNTLLSHYGLTYQKIVSMLTKVKLYKLLAKITPTSTKRSIPMDEYGETVDFNKSIIFSPSLNSGLFINNRNFSRNQTSILIKKLSSLNINGEKPIEHVYLRRDVIWGPYADRAADIYLIPKYGYEISHRMVPSHLACPKAFGDIRTGTHRPAGVFIAYGPDIRQGIKLNEPFFTWDIAPLILHMLSLSIPGYMDGCVRKEMFKRGSRPSVTPIKYERVTEREQTKMRLKTLRKRRSI